MVPVLKPSYSETSRPGAWTSGSAASCALNITLNSGLSAPPVCRPSRRVSSWTGRSWYGSARSRTSVTSSTASVPGAAGSSRRCSGTVFTNMPTVPSKPSGRLPTAVPTTSLAVPGAPAQQFGEEREQGAERGVPVLLAAGAQPLGEVGADRLAHLAAAVAAHRAGVGQPGQGDLARGVGQLPQPEGERALAGVRVDGRAGVLLVRGRLGQLVGLAEDVGAVDGEQVAQQDREGVAVVDEVVLDVDQPVVVRAEAHQVPAQHRRLLGVHRLLGLGGQQLAEGGLRVGLGGEVAAAQRRFAVLGDPLAGQALRAGDQFQAQARVVCEDGGQSGVQRVLVEGAPEVEHGGEVVRTTAGQHLLVQPDDLLRGGERKHR